MCIVFMGIGPLYIVKRSFWKLPCLCHLPLAFLRNQASSARWLSPPVPLPIRNSVALEDAGFLDGIIYSIVFHSMAY